jgi:hypothetical protein
MAHFAKIVNGIVEQVIVADTQQWCEENLGGTWVQTSYTASIRKNYAGVGMSYRDDLDAFIPVKCHDEATLNEDTCLWDCTNTEHTVEVSE